MLLILSAFQIKSSTFYASACSHCHTLSLLHLFPSISSNSHFSLVLISGTAAKCSEPFNIPPITFASNIYTHPSSVYYPQLYNLPSFSVPLAKVYLWIKLCWKVFDRNGPPSAPTVTCSAHSHSPQCPSS